MTTNSINPNGMPPQNLLLCFDAFGTLFKPRYAIPKQYGDVARNLGYTGFSDDDLSQSFKAAFKNEATRNPNYGKANGMNATDWWTNIIQNTFNPLVGTEQPLHQDLAPRLLHRFASDEGYVLFPDVMPLLKRLRDAHQASNTKIIVGVITNSDDRIPGVLAALGMRVSPLRYGMNPSSSSPGEGPFDIDFTVMSYDVGYEKPDRQIFIAAEETLKHVRGTAGTEELAELDPERWRKIYIGDEYDKDVVGSLAANWNAALIEREGTGKRGDVAWLDEQPVGSLYEVFTTTKAVGFSSLAKLAGWLPSAP